MTIDDFDMHAGRLVEVGYEHRAPALRAIAEMEKAKAMHCIAQELHMLLQVLAIRTATASEAAAK